MSRDELELTFHSRASAAVSANAAGVYQRNGHK